MAEPSGARNISQSLFMLDEKLSTCTNGQALNDTSMVSSWNTSEVDVKGIGCQQPAYINQSRLSTWYQDNGSQEVLLFSNQFGLPVMGGEYNNKAESGHRPGNVLKQVPKPGYALNNDKYYKINYPKYNEINITESNGISRPSFMNPFKAEWNNMN